MSIFSFPFPSVEIEQSMLYHRPIGGKGNDTDLRCSNILYNQNGMIISALLPFPDKSILTSAYTCCTPSHFTLDHHSPARLK
jgi:hypothetical protein